MIIHYTKEKWSGDPAADRDKFLGGSDAGTILNLNPYKSAYTLWAEKTGTIKTEDISDKLAVWFGTEEEEIVAKRFCIESGKQVRRSYMSYGLQEYPFLKGHVDRLIVGENAGLECKTTGGWNKTDFSSGDIPHMHYAQCQFYMLVTGKTKWYYAVKRDNNQFYWTCISRDDEYISAMLERLTSFWQLVQSKTPPEIDGSVSTTETLGKEYPGDVEDKDIVYLSDDIDELLHERKELKEAQDGLKAEISTIDNQLKEAIGNAQKGESGHFKVGWSNVPPRETIDIKRLKIENPGIYEKYVNVGNSYRRFTVTEKKERIAK